MRIGICHSVLDADALYGVRADFLEQHIQDLLVPEEPEQAFSANARAARAAAVPLLAANCFLPEHIKTTGPDVDTGRITVYGDVAFARARQVGIDIMVYGSGASRKAPAGFDQDRARQQFVDILGRLAPLAEKHGIMIAVEPLQVGEDNVVNTVDQGAEVVRAVDHPRVRLLVDIFHMLRNGESPDAISRHGELIVHAHVAEKAERTPPGHDGDDFVPYLRALREIGYAGGLAIEAKWKDISREAKPAMDALRKQCVAAGCVDAG
jgi:sugar phosphate isomerase/epimerase